jgi:uncharacterized membrane protein YcgQ (UPF0703/DUF1980 family)
MDPCNRRDPQHTGVWPVERRKIVMRVKLRDKRCMTFSLLSFHFTVSYAMLLFVPLNVILKSSSVPHLVSRSIFVTKLTALIIISKPCRSPEIDMRRTMIGSLEFSDLSIYGTNRSLVMADAQRTSASQRFHLYMPPHGGASQLSPTGRFITAHCLY